ncbi:hypothetical protein D3C77_423360 [compost metagenome]
MKLISELSLEMGLVPMNITAGANKPIAVIQVNTEANSSLLLIRGHEPFLNPMGYSITLRENLLPGLLASLGAKVLLKFLVTLAFLMSPVSLHHHGGSIQLCGRVHVLQRHFSQLKTRGG